jgi:hypothetical protein
MRVMPKSQVISAAGKRDSGRVLAAALALALADAGEAARAAAADATTASDFGNSL